MKTKTKHTRPTLMAISLPSPGARQTTVRVPIYEETDFRVQQHDDPLTGLTWTLAIETDYRKNPDPSPPIGATLATLSVSIAMREGIPTLPVTSEVVGQRRDGWFDATTEEIARRGRWLRETRREEAKRLNLAKQRGLHLLRCSRCNELSDLNATRWRLTLDGAETTACCPRCT